MDGSISIGVGGLLNEIFDPDDECPYCHISGYLSRNRKHPFGLKHAHGPHQPKRRCVYLGRFKIRGQCNLSEFFGKVIFLGF